MSRLGFPQDMPGAVFARGGADPLAHESFQTRCDALLSERGEVSGNLPARVDVDFQLLFRSWFNRGFLVLREIDWNSPANVREKIIAYEAAHAISSRDAPKRRKAGTASRRNKGRTQDGGGNSSAGRQAS